MDYLTTHTTLSPIRRGLAPGFVNYKKGCTLLAAASDKAYQLLAHDWWFAPGTPTSSTTKTGRHDIAEILLKVALSTTNQSTYVLSGRAWSYINEFYSKTQSAVIVIKCKSNYFDANEGTRQRGVLSGFLYLVFINEFNN